MKWKQMAVVAAAVAVTACGAAFAQDNQDDDKPGQYPVFFEQQRNGKTDNKQTDRWWHKDDTKATADKNKKDNQRFGRPDNRKDNRPTDNSRYQKNGDRRVDRDRWGSGRQVRHNRSGRGWNDSHWGHDKRHPDHQRGSWSGRR